MGKQSAGLLLYRYRKNVLEVLLVHPGGPFWENKDTGAWSIPKGEPFPDENLLDAAKRECGEETGFRIGGIFDVLAPVRLPGGKIVHAWAVRCDLDADAVTSNTFTMEWPPRSGHVQTFPEVDRAGWFDLETARQKMARGQVDLLAQLSRCLRT